MCNLIVWALLLIGVNLVSALILMVISFIIAFNPRFYQWAFRHYMKSMSDLDSDS